MTRQRQERLIILRFMLQDKSLTLARSSQSPHFDASAPAVSAEVLPYVSVVIPCLNEERFIEKVLENLAPQYNSGRYEIIVVDGMSVDKTRMVVSEFMARHRNVQVRLVDNPARNIPAGLNRGIAQARGDVIVRMDAHSIPSENYVRRCVELLSNPNVSVVGMPWRIRASADTLTARAIALAVAHPFGIGDAKYRLPDLSAPQFVDTVPFGVFRKSLWQDLGGFNEELLANEDYDFHYRVRYLGGRILLDTSGHCVYFARATIRDLASQYFRYGNWKSQMVKLHPRSIRWRQLVAPAFVSSIFLLMALSFWSALALWALLMVVATYTLLSLISAFQLARREGALSIVPIISLAFSVIHTAWGSGFLIGLVRPPR